MRVATGIATALLVLCAAAAAATSPTIFGTYSPQVKDGIFTNMNYWLGLANEGQGPQQALRVIEVGWAAPDSGTGKVAAVDDIRNAWGWNGAVPLVSWMPYGYKTWTSPTPNEDIVSGLYDDYIDAFLSQLSSKFIYEPNAAVKRAYLRFAPQPNGNWFPWSPYCPQCASTGQQINQTAASYVAMWKYVAAKVRDPKYKLTPDTVQLVFDAATASPGGGLESFLPPDELIDWFVMTGINWGTTLPGNQWVTPKQLFGPTLAQLRGFNATKPTGISSAGTTSHPNGVEAKNAWITQLCDFVTSNALKLMTYHNADSNTDIAVFGGQAGLSTFSSPVQNETFKTYPAFLSCVASKSFAGRNSSDPRYLSNAQFMGL